MESSQWIAMIRNYRAASRRRLPSAGSGGRWKERSAVSSGLSPANRSQDGIAWAKAIRGFVGGVPGYKLPEHAHQRGRTDGAVATHRGDGNAASLQRLFLCRHESRNGDGCLRRLRLAEQPFVGTRIKPEDRKSGRVGKWR